MKISNSNNYELISLDSIINKLSKQYSSLYFAEIDDQLYIYRAINRKEYKDILSADINNLEKQDQICLTCILYPENFNIDECDGGVPEQLYKEIINKSCISIEDMIILIEMNRQEMELLDNQMSCIISEAFPSYKLEEIETMDMIQFTKLFSRAEWILKTFKNHELNEDIVDILSQAIDIDNNIEVKNIETNEKTQTLKPTQEDVPMNTEKSNRAKMTDEQLKEYQEFCKKFPEFNMATDYAFTGDIGPGFDQRSPALRPGWGIPKNN